MGWSRRETYRIGIKTNHISNLWARLLLTFYK